MTVTEPTVSTAESRRIAAPRSAIRRAPIASVTLSVGNKPSGTSATITPVAKVRAVRNSTFVLSAATDRVAAPARTANTAVRRDRLLTCRSNTDSPRRTPSTRAAIWPIVLSGPVAQTTASAEPLTTPDPDGATQVNAVAGRLLPAAGTGFASRSTATDSPVIIDISSERLSDASSTQSAGMTSPAETRTTSPGTRSTAGTARSVPLRSTRAFTATLLIRLRRTCSARNSWANAKMPLMPTTATIAAPSSGMPDANDNPAANQRRSASVCVKFARNVASKRVCAAWIGAFAPKTTCNCSACSSLIPVGAESSNRKRSAGNAAAILAMPGRGWRDAAELRTICAEPSALSCTGSRPAGKGKCN